MTDQKSVTELVQEFLNSEEFDVQNFFKLKKIKYDDVLFEEFIEELTRQTIYKNDNRHEIKLNTDLPKECTR